MPITSNQIKFYKSSTGIGLGGSINLAAEIASGGINNIFDDVSASEALAGDTEYRCIFVRNENSTITLKDALAYIDAQTSSPDTSIEIGLGTAGPDTDEQTIPDEDTPPVGVVFESGVGEGNAITVGDIAANGGYHALWIKRVVNAAAGATSSDVSTITVQGETTA